MKKALKAIRFCIFVFFFSLFMCFPAYADTGSYFIGDISVSSSEITFKADTSSGLYSVSLDGKYGNIIIPQATALSGTVIIVTPIPSKYFSYPQSLFNADRLTLSGRNSTGFPSVNLVCVSSLAHKPYVKVLQNEIVFNGQSSLFSENMALFCSFDHADSYHVDVECMFYIRTTLYYVAGVNTASGSLPLEPDFGTYRIDYKFPSTILGYGDNNYAHANDIVVQTNALKSAISSQTTSINNAISSQTTSINANIDNTRTDIVEAIENLGNGYNAGGMMNDANSLENSLNNYDDQESNLTDSAFSNIGMINYVRPTGSVMASITFCTSFLQSLFFNMGDFNIFIVISLSLTFALMVIGWFRFRK